MDGRSEAGRTSLETARSTYQEAQRQAFYGYDPYDALLSPLVTLPWVGRRRFLRFGLSQVVLRSPVNLRPLLGIPPQENAKAHALFLTGAAALWRATDDEAWREACRAHAGRLLQIRATEFQNAAWGYPFPWQGRFFYLPAGFPTVVTTSFVGNALIDAYDVLGDEELLATVESACRFVLEDLNRTQDGATFCFSYSPVDETRVYNATLLATRFLARAAVRAGREDWMEAASASLAYVLARQHEDGSWDYGEGRHQGWCDGFHTCFNLESILDYRMAGGPVACDDAYGRGTRFWKENFLLPDGTVRYFARRTHPLDAHNFGTAIRLLARQGDEAEAARCLATARARLAGRRPGTWKFRRGRGWTNAVHFLRWSGAWMFAGASALAELVARTPSAEDGSQVEERLG